jgi:hypothetical protein
MEAAGDTMQDQEKRRQRIDGDGKRAQLRDALDSVEAHSHVHGAGNYELIDLDNNARSEATGATSMGTILWSSCGIALSESQRATLNV